MKKKFLIGLICAMAITLGSTGVTTFASDSGPATVDKPAISNGNGTDTSKGSGETGDTSSITVNNMHKEHHLMYL